MIVRDGLATVAEWEAEHGAFSDAELSPITDARWRRLWRGNVNDLWRVRAAAGETLDQLGTCGA